MMRLNPKNTSFLCCDIQGKFRKLIYGFDSVVGTAQKMIETSKILDIPLVVTEQSPSKLESTVPELDISTAALIHHKTQFSMMTPSVVSFLKEKDIRSVVLFGIESHVCVSQTTLDCLELGIIPWIVSDGVSSMNKWEVGIALSRLSKAGAIISTSDSIIFELVKDANHAKFRDISGLIKTISASKNVSERMLLELQGTIEFSSDDKTIGSFTWDGQTPILVIGHHRLTGKVVSLTKPLYLLGKEKDPLGFKVMSVVNKKIVFKNRPEHIMSAQFTDLQIFNKR